MSAGFAYEAISNLMSDAACGALLGAGIGLKTSIALLASSDRSIFTMLLLGAGITLTGTYLGALGGLRFFKASEYHNNIIENLNNNLEDVTHRIFFGN